MSNILQMCDYIANFTCSAATKKSINVNIRFVFFRFAMSVCFTALWRWQRNRAIKGRRI